MLRILALTLIATTALLALSVALPPTTTLLAPLAPVV
jgi:hypothetical protein